PHPGTRWPLLPYTTLFRSPRRTPRTSAPRAARWRHSGSHPWEEPMPSDPVSTFFAMSKRPSRIDLLELDIDLRLEKVDPGGSLGDRKSTRLNSSHVSTSYA